jgi:cytochrome c553
VDIDQLVKAVNASGATPEQLTAMLTRTAILGEIAAMRSRIANEQAARQVAIDAHDATLRTLAQHLAALETQANAILAM